MPLGISYMGTKRALAEAVAGVVEASNDGPLLDAFAGMCSVGTAVGSKRPIWNNDLQIFASTVSAMFFCARELPPVADDVAAAIFTFYDLNRRALLDVYAISIAEEDEASRKLNVQSFEALWTSNQQDAAETYINPSYAHLFPYDLFAATYGGSYLGVRQCIDIDSIRFAIDHSRRTGALSDEAHQWVLLALGRAMSRCTTSTGHFAQPLRPKASNVKRFARQRSRSVWQEWIAAIRVLRPLGTSEWRRSNRSLRADTCSLMTNPPADLMPAVVYADPPYTKDQYSRYYHLYETLILYDYPRAIGTGRYRPDRSVSAFSTKSGVSKAFETLISSVANLGADLLISYPTGGLLTASEQSIPDLMSTHFRRVDQPIKMQHVHSTMGGSKGEASSAVTEVLYRASAW